MKEYKKPELLVINVDIDKSLLLETSDGPGEGSAKQGLNFFDGDLSDEDISVLNTLGQN